VRACVLVCVVGARVCMCMCACVWACVCALAHKRATVVLRAFLLARARVIMTWVRAPVTVRARVRAAPGWHVHCSVHAGGSDRCRRSG
jgi:hypothetical protein